MSNAKPKIRIAVVTHASSINAWAAHMLLQITNSNVAEIVALIKTNRSKNKTPLVLQSYKHIDEKIFATNQYALCKLSFPSLHTETIIDITGKSTSLNNEQQLANLHIDVMLVIDECTVASYLYKHCNFGIWKIESNYSCIDYCTTPGVIDFFNKNALSISKLVAYTEPNQTGHVLYESASCTHGFSVTQNINQVLWKSSYFPARILKQLYLQEKQPASIIQQKYPLHHHCIPKTNFTFYIRKSAEKILHKFIYKDQWCLQVDTNYNGTNTFVPSITLKPSLDKFWADPFVVHQDGLLYIFYEEMNCKTNKAHLSVLITDRSGNIKDNRIILTKDYHLSYPFIFKHEETWYMIPETTGAKNIQLYECCSFPFEWKFKQTLMQNIHAADVTLHRHNNEWFMFANVKEHEGMCDYDELHVYHSQNLFSTEWIPHCQNPVISNASAARPAGRIFEYNGQLVRPSQNSSGTYGYAINLNVIETLNNNTYTESKMSEVLPNKEHNILCTHTLNIHNNCAVTDVIISRNKWRA